MSTSTGEPIDELISDLQGDFGLTRYHWSDDFFKTGSYGERSIGGTSIIWQKKIKQKQSPLRGQMVGVKAVTGQLTDAASKNEERKRHLCKYLRREFRVWKALSHPNIAELLGFVTDVKDNEFPAFLMPWYDNKNLRDYLGQKYEKGVYVEKKKKFQFLRDIALGLEYLHSKNIVHRDLKGRNILVDKDEKIYLSDFGSSKFLLFELQDLSSSSAFNDNIQWMPPEYIKRDEYGRFFSTEQYHDPSPAGDIWSYGCTFLEILRVGDPYPANYPEARMMLFERKAPPVPSALEPLTLTRTQTHFLQTECCNINPNERISVAEVINRLDAFVTAEQSKDL